MNRYWMIGALLPLALLGTGCGTREVSAAAGGEPATVRVARVQQTNFAAESSYAATLEPVTQMELAFRAPGEVAAVYLKNGRPLEPGDEVPAGSVLARLRKTEYEARTKSAEAQLGDARAARVSGAAQIQEAEAGLTLAEQDLRRAERLFEGQALTRAELDAARARSHSAQSRLAAAKANLDGLDSRIRGSHAALEESRVPLADTVLTVSFPAVIVARHVERGSTVGAGTGAYTVADLRQVKVRFGVPDRALAGVLPGSTVSMYVDALPGEHYQGRIVGVAPVADPATRLFQVEALVANAGHKLRAGMVASAVTGAQATRLLPAVPLRSIRRLGDNNRFAVLVVERDAVQLREVTLGPTQDDLIGILSGASPGELVVEDAGAGLRAGDRVRAIAQ